MSGEDHWRGNSISKDESGAWRYEDGTLVSTDPGRGCGACGLGQTKAGHDGCLGLLPGVLNACCGHGDEASAYVQLADGSILRRESAADFFEGASG